MAFSPSVDEVTIRLTGEIGREPVFLPAISKILGRLLATFQRATIQCGGSATALVA